jgi:hypothetical protein
VIELKQHLFFRPRLRHVLDAWLADIIDQDERQTVFVWPAKLIRTGPSAIFRDRTYSTGLLNCDRVTCNRIRAPDLCFWPSRHHVKCAVGIDRPDSTERVRPRARQSSRTRRRSGRTRGYQHYQRTCENNSERMLWFHWRLSCLAATKPVKCRSCEEIGCQKLRLRPTKAP